MNSGTLESWAHAVRAAALPGAPAELLRMPRHRLTEAILSFRDGAGQCREGDRLFLSVFLGSTGRNGARETSLDLRAWGSLLSGDPPPTPLSDRGPLTGFGGLFGAHAEFPHGDSTSIEILTEQELACLHAFSWLEGLTTRVREAATWLIENIQPDNATARPWSAHVFSALAAEGHVDAGLYAQTLVHNTLVASGGTPEPLSACILLDSAEWASRYSRRIPFLPRHEP